MYLLAEAKTRYMYVVSYSCSNTVVTIWQRGRKLIRQEMWQNVDLKHYELHSQECQILDVYHCKNCQTSRILFLHAFFWVIPGHLFSSHTFFCINTPTFSTPVILHTYLPMKMEQTECSEMLNSDTGELPRRKHTTFRTRQKFEIKSVTTYLIFVLFV